MTEPHFVSTGEVAELSESGGVRIIDARFSLDDTEAGRREYERAHIPGAVYLHWLDDLSDPDDPVLGQLAPPLYFRRAMEDAGISDDSLVVAYDDNVLFTAARVWWSLRRYGHDAVRILDGGLPRWIAEGRPVESGSPSRIERGSFTPRPARVRRSAKDDVTTLVSGRARPVQLLDCRMDATWTDAGAHIPGARRLPAPGLVDPASGRLRPPAEIRRLAAAAGADPDAPIVLYCGGGVSASLAYAALESAGYTDLTLYDGSWSEWSADPELPQEPH